MAALESQALPVSHAWAVPGAWSSVHEARRGAPGRCSAPLWVRLLPSQQHQESVITLLSVYMDQTCTEHLPRGGHSAQLQGQRDQLSSSAVTLQVS